MQLKATALLKDELQVTLADFSSYDRMSVDVSDLIRAVYKEFHAGGAYAKGKQREFLAWAKKTFPASMFMAFERAAGNRQDLAFEGAVPILVNRKLALEFLKQLVFTPGADNTLEKFLWRVLSCNEMTAQLRVNTLWHYTFSQPARYLAGKSCKLKDWSIDSSSAVMDLVEKAMVQIAADGHTILDPNFDPFSSIAAEQPVFDKWRKDLLLRTVQAADGTEYFIHQRALSEARNPEGEGEGQTMAEQTEYVVKLAEAMANAALVAMRDPRRAICGLLLSQA